MQAQAERMRRLIDDLMSLSRIELAEHIPPSGNVDMAAAVIDVLDAGPLAKGARHPAPDVAGARRGHRRGGSRQINQVIQEI